MVSASVTHSSPVSSVGCYPFDQPPSPRAAHVREAALLAHHGDTLSAQLEADPAAALTCPDGLPAACPGGCACAPGTATAPNPGPSSSPTLAGLDTTELTFSYDDTPVPGSSVMSLSTAWAPVRVIGTSQALRAASKRSSGRPRWTAALGVVRRDGLDRVDVAVDTPDACDAELVEPRPSGLVDLDDDVEFLGERDERAAARGGLRRVPERPTRGVAASC